ncbi:MAG: glycine cleavage system protein GcvH [Deltaproteobacteria bacterium]
METYFTKEHEWVKIKDGIASVGISDFAAHQLGDITFVELPAVGKSVKQFEQFAAIESVKAASDIYAPLSGRVTTVNEALDTHPEIINEDAEENGWLAGIEISEPAGKKALMIREEYDEYLRGLP